MSKQYEATTRGTAQMCLDMSKDERKVEMTNSKALIRVYSEIGDSEPREWREWASSPYPTVEDALADLDQAAADKDPEARNVRIEDASGKLLDLAATRYIGRPQWL